MLSASIPFGTKNMDYEIINSPVIFPDRKWSEISMLCKHFILQLLDKSSSRIQPAEALKHPWFENIFNGSALSPVPKYIKTRPLIEKDIFIKLMQYRKVSKLKSVALGILVKTMSPE